MIKPIPHKLKCPSCGYSKVISPKSDVVNPTDFMGTCPKCKTMMGKTELNRVEKLLRGFL